MDLSEVKRDEGLLLSVLGLKKGGRHEKCPFHPDGHGSLSVWRQGEVWFWKCHSGCGSGTILDAAMLRYNAQGAGAALRAIERELGVRIGRDEEYVEPRLDKERAERMVAFAHKTLLESFELQEEYLVGKRRIHDLAVVRHYRIGFILNHAFAGWGSWRLTGWVMPVTDADGELLAVKIHTEMKRDQYTKNIPKCLWAPFGTYPENQPKHGTYTLWPPPERWQAPDQLCVCPGELKALAMIDVGVPATSPTVGEGKALPRRLIDRLVKVRARELYLAYDNDPTGRAWRDQNIDALAEAGLHVTAVDLGSGKKPKPLPPPPPRPAPDPEPNSPADLGYGPPPSNELLEELNADWAIAHDDRNFDHDAAEG